MLGRERRERVRTLAFYSDRQWLPNIEYDLVGTPCETVVSQSLCVYASGVQRRFPSDLWLVENGIESYAGTTLRDSRGNVLGLISILSRQPLPDPDSLRFALEIFASRAAAEIERQQVEESLRASQAALAESEERFRGAFEHAALGMALVAPDGRYMKVNSALCQMVGYGEDELLTTSVSAMAAQGR